MRSRASRQQTFSAKVQIVSIVGFAGQTASVVSTQLSHCYVKATIDNTKINGHVCVATEL